MSKAYKFTFKKDDVFVEYCTTDKESLARQFQIWVTNASIYAYQKQKEQETKEKYPIKEEPKIEETVIVLEPKQDEIFEEKQEAQELSDVNENDKITLNTILQNNNDNTEEYKQNLNEIKQDIAEKVEYAGEISDSLNNLYNKNSVNALDNLKDTLENEEEKFTNNLDDFDKILEKSMNNPTFVPEIQKDERFLKIINMKNITTNLGYLIITAYYLSEFEKLDKFTLKLINTKLMQNTGTVIDHNILQDAIDDGYVEKLPTLPDIPAVEYRLTVSGEEAFLNGTQF